MAVDADVTIAEESPFADGVATLIAASDAFAAALYPPESNHGATAEALAKPEVRFFVARLAGEAVGCAAIARDVGGWSEVKRVFVADVARGRNLGRRLMDVLEAAARADGATCLRLETGVHNSAALRLYRSLGFRTIDRFGAYPDDPVSIFMEKLLG